MSPITYKLRPPTPPGVRKGSGRGLTFNFVATLPQVDPERPGIYGTSYGGATVVWVGAVDPRVQCVVSVVGIGNGRRWMRSVRRPDEFHDLLARAREDRVKRALEGKSAFVPARRSCSPTGSPPSSAPRPGATTPPPSA